MTGTKHPDALPDDLLAFIPADDTENESLELSEEEAAIHSIADSPRTPLDDPAQREINGSSQGLPPAAWFEDEEPEPPYPSPEAADVAAVDDVLAAQHYLFDIDDSSDRD